jgi:hypothetical protein
MSGRLTCDGTAGCTGVVTSIDHKGWIYCHPCANRLRGSRPVRKMTRGELETIRRGEPIAHY